MKKSFISLGLIVAATFALTNCAKELENPSQQPESAGIPFEITASTPDTKTANDGYNTVWVADDAVNVFHAEKGSSTYVSDGEFTLTSGTSFTGTISEKLTADEYDWYVYYPYSNYNKTPAGTSSQNFSYQSIAQSSSGSQQQNGYDNMAHLSGNRFPMYGKATVAKDGDVNVSMNHLVAVAEITVTNANTDPLLVTDVTFTSEQNIVGTFYVDFTGNEPDFAEGDNVSKTASLTVSNGTEIAEDGTAKFYIAFKPFIATSGQKLTIAVNGYSKEITLQADVEFKAGKIKKLNFEYDAPTVIYETAFDYAIVGSSYQSSSEIIGTDEGTTTSWGIVYGNWNSSNCAQMRVYSAGNFGSTYMKFDVSYVTSVSYKAKVSNTALKLNTYYSVDSGQTWTKVDNNKVLTTSLDEYSFIVSETGAYDKVRVKFEAAGGAPASSNYQLTIDDVKIYGKGEVLVDKDPTIIVENASVSVGASSVLAEFEYSLIDIDGEPSVSVTSDEYGIIVGEPSVSDGIVSVNLKENTENIAKSATLTLSYTGADDVILTVNQAAYVSGQKTYKWVIENKEQLGTGTEGYSGTVKLGDVDWDIERTLVGTEGFTGNSITNGYLQIGKNGGAENMTFNTSDITGVIKSVSVDCAAYKSKHSVSVTVGGTSYISNSVPTWSNSTGSELTGSGTSSGEIVIAFTANEGARALYIKSITIVYE